jgi:hypothetical protein
MRIRALMLGVLALALLAPAGVSAQQATNCKATVDLVLSPGLSNEPGSGTFTSNGETGETECDGPVNGKEPTGKGTFGSEGHYGTEDPDSCTSGGEGDAKQSSTVPTKDGEEKVTNNATFTFGALQGGGTFGGEFKGDKADGTFEVTPTEGDCVSKPITKITVTLDYTLK